MYSRCCGLNNGSSGEDIRFCCEMNAVVFRQSEAFGPDHDAVWDDSELIAAYDEAMAEYAALHNVATPQSVRFVRL